MDQGWSEAAFGIPALALPRLICQTENAMSITVSQKRRGRPPTGETPRVGVRLESDLLREVDGWADKKGVSRSDAIRYLLQLAVAAEGNKRSPTKEEQ